MANIDEWKWKLSLLLRNEKDQEVVSRDKRDRRDYEQISNLAKRMGLYRYMSILVSRTFVVFIIDLVILARSDKDRTWFNLPPLFEHIVKCMGRSSLPARFLSQTTGQIWMISAHKGR